MTKGRAHLGREGEQSAADILSAWELGSGFEIGAVVSAFPLALAEMKARLQERGAEVYSLSPNKDFEEQREGLSRRLTEAENRVVVWLEQGRFDQASWRATLSGLNRQRSWLQTQCPAFFMLAGPPELFELAQVNAPDLWSTASPIRELKQSPDWIRGGGSLRWLHISDLHFKETERWDRRATLQALMRKSDELIQEGLKPDLVFVTGDIAYSGKRQEYEQAERFFSELSQKLDLEPRERWFLVPGNHDVDRAKIGRAEKVILQSLANEQDIEEIVHDAATMKLLGRRLAEFYAFTERFLGAGRGWREDLPWRSDVRDIGGTRVGVLQLNSAWAGGTNGDQRNLLIGEAQVRFSLEATRDALVRIALLHHPLADLKEFDEERATGLLGAPDGAHFLLRGHRHKTKAAIQGSPDGLLAEIAAGALYVENSYPRGFNLAELNLETGQASFRFFRYSQEGRGFWAPDTEIYEKAPDGTWTFALPESLHLGGAARPAEKVRQPITEALLQSTAVRYRQAAAAYHGRARFIGFADHRPRPNAKMTELFVPLKLGRRKHPWTVLSATGANIAGSVDRWKDWQPWSTAELVQRLYKTAQRGSERPLHSWDPSARIAVLGAPGSGKSTLCRFLTVALAGEVELPGVRSRADLLPLLLPFREYVRQAADANALSLIEFLNRQAQTELSLALPEGFLERMLKMGRAVLLLDGLDEVGRPEERTKMRDRVLAFLQAYPNCALLVTSRMAGYDEAPLPEQFEHLELALFEDDDLREFVKRWYAIQEPEDAVGRDRGIADLIAAITAEPRITELARNPMLATLMALVHRFEAHLPGERAKLYELCVKTLLETWPAATGRSFLEIDPGLQRVYLEKLAYEMQSERAEGHHSVIIPRNSLIAKLDAILEERKFKDLPAESRRRLAESWVEYLEEGSGLLVEQSTGSFAFFHLSFLEYLAARGWERKAGAASLPGAIPDRLGEAAWEEVCLLTVGVHAEDGLFLDALFGAVTGSEHSDRWVFLLRALREEAIFKPEQRERVLEEAGREALEQGLSHRHAAGILNDVIRFSVRNGESVRVWLENGLRQRTGEALRVAAALRLWREETIGLLDSRRNQPEAAPALLEFWPGSELGAWAADRVQPTAALAWALAENPDELLHLRGIAAMQQDTALPAALSLALASRSLQLGSLIKQAHEVLARLGHPGGHGMPEALQVRSGEILLPAEPLLPAKPTAKRKTRTPLARGLARNLTRGFDGEAVLGEMISWAIGFHADVAHDITHDFARDVLRHVPDNFRDYFSHDFRHAFASEFAHAFAHPSDRVRPYGGDFTAEFQKLEVKPASQPVPPASPATSDTARQTHNGFGLIAGLAGEMFIALAATAEEPTDDRLSYVFLRLQNRWLLEIWSTLDEQLPLRPASWQLAVYLALGWTQFSTTWTWPQTERWSALFAKDAPEHWLPRAHWHLCWLTYDPNLQAHLEALDTALKDGETDTALTGYAAALHKILGR